MAARVVSLGEITRGVASNRQRTTCLLVAVHAGREGASFVDRIFSNVCRAISALYRSLRASIS
eukprot:6049098-Pleurochrysis_carterae.AAC.1